MLVINPKWEEKLAWGRTRCLVDSPKYSLHELQVDAGSVCSFHYHEERANRFIVVSGIVRVVWLLGWQTHYEVLSADTELDIPSMVPHQFQVLESGEMLEEYYPDRGGDVENGDICRLTQGSKMSVDLLVGDVGVVDSDGSWRVGTILGNIQ